jgi:hypothetical protein
MTGRTLLFLTPLLVCPGTVLARGSGAYFRPLRSGRQAGVTHNVIVPR